MPLKGQTLSEESKQLIRDARAKQVHPLLAAKGVTKEQWDEAISNRQRWCGGDCQSFLPFALFSSNRTMCKKCNAAKRARWRAKVDNTRLRRDDETIRRWREENPDYHRRRDWMRKYGITPEWYEKTLAEQGGHCALCPATTAHPTDARMLFVDHCHSTGSVRGILCAKCNTHLGIVEADQSWHDRALDYLTREISRDILMPQKLSRTPPTLAHHHGHPRRSFRLRKDLLLQERLTAIQT